MHVFNIHIYENYARQSNFFRPCVLIYDCVCNITQSKQRHLNTMRQRQNGRHLPDDIFKCISLNENVWISIEISLKFVRKGSINNIPALVQMMAWRRPGDKPLSEPMMASLLTHICVTRPQWVNGYFPVWVHYSPKLLLICSHHGFSSYVQHNTTNMY